MAPHTLSSSPLAILLAGKLSRKFYFMLSCSVRPRNVVEMMIFESMYYPRRMAMYKMPLH